MWFRDIAPHIGTINVYCMQCGSISPPVVGPLRFRKKLARIRGRFDINSCQL